MNRAIAALFAVILALVSNDGEALPEAKGPRVAVEVQSVVVPSQQLLRKVKLKKRRLK